jgi:hypothetical protein
MGCVYHPNNDAAKACEQCQADLCESCAISLDNGRIHCHRCMLALSLYDVKNESTKLREQEKTKRLGLEKRWRPSYLQALLTVGGVLALLLVGLQIHWNQPVHRPRVVLDTNHPMRLLSQLQLAIAQYSAAHKDRYPDSLYDLLPDFLADTGQNRKVLRNSSYGLDERNGYVLRIKSNAPFPGKELVATANDITVSGEEASR